MASYPKDRFDQLPEDLARVGAHRAPARRGRGWIIFAWAALATGILVFGGLFGISRILDIDLGLGLVAGEESTPTPTPTPTPTMDAVTDPSTIDPARAFTITVLNGSPIVGAQNTIGDQLAGAGWPVGTRSNASTSDLETTHVYYSNPEDEGIARGLVAALGFGEIELVPAESFPGAPITIVVGADFQPASTEG
ncbi:hypothetical protein HDC94_001052 [Leifsonia sp. AK011]|uniref:LytR C-terminal domain-containing protein n=1 Tax=Leifsonia sp. AK011 TaxID=2723075 RepID=UPI0015C993AF|nr:LytR C-terminal domain-containing protein [Leifsonia sp. AK011]NYF09896.1 hypothetical protein [Leifsonia sp. AK011]